MVKEGKEDTTSLETTMYTGALKNYTFKETDGMTEVIVELSPIMEIPEDYGEMYHDMWYNALRKLKDLGESQ